MDDRDRCTPITLTAHKPISQTIVGFEITLTAFFQLLDDGDLCFFAGHAVKFTAVGEDAVFGERQCVIDVFTCTFDDSFNRKTKFACKDKVAIIVGCNTHDCTCAV